MRVPMKPLCAGLAFVWAAGCGGSSQSDADPTSQAKAPPSVPDGVGAAVRGFDSRRAFADLRRQVRIGPRPSGSPGSARERRLILLRLRAAGVRRIHVQRPYRNVVARIPGKRRGTVVIGAHFDTKNGIPGFVGANDGASGVAVLLELARALPNPFPGPGLTLAFFDAEEARGERPFQLDGARGSRQFVGYARGGRRGSPPLGEIRAMYLLDMVGDCDLQIPREANSDPDLYGRLKGPAFGGRAGAILDDHVPFLERGVAAVDVIDFDYGPGGSPGAWWHTRRDSIGHVCPASLGQIGRAVMRAVGTL